MLHLKYLVNPLIQNGAHSLITLGNLYYYKHSVTAPLYQCSLFVSRLLTCRSPPCCTAAFALFRLIDCSILLPPSESAAGYISIFLISTILQLLISCRPFCHLLQSFLFLIPSFWSLIPIFLKFVLSCLAFIL